MADYQCRYCQDQGNCARCSYFFESDKVHSACGRLWRDHKKRGGDAYYPPIAVCPPRAARAAAPAPTEGES